MADDKQGQKAGGFDPTEHRAPEVIEHLEEATEAEKAEIAAAERQGAGRVTVLKAAGVDPDARTDASGRELFPWEVAPKKKDD